MVQDATAAPGDSLEQAGKIGIRRDETYWNDDGHLHGLGSAGNRGNGNAGAEDVDHITRREMECSWELGLRRSGRGDYGGKFRGTQKLRSLTINTNGFVVEADGGFCFTNAVNGVVGFEQFMILQQ